MCSFYWTNGCLVSPLLWLSLLSCRCSAPVWQGLKQTTVLIHIGRTLYVLLSSLPLHPKKISTPNPIIPHR